MFDHNIYCFTFTNIHLQVYLKAKNKDSSEKSKSKFNFTLFQHHVRHEGLVVFLSLDKLVYTKSVNGEQADAEIVANVIDFVHFRVLNASFTIQLFFEFGWSWKRY